MSQKYRGTIDELKQIVKSTGIVGGWESDGTGKSEKHIYRTPAGGILNWWSNGTVNFQGNDFAKGVLERTLHKLLLGPRKLEPRNASNTCNTEPNGVIQYGVDPITTNQPQRRLQNSYDTPSLLKRVKDTLANSGLTVMLVNDSTFIVRETAYDHYCSLVDKGSEIYIRKM